MPTVSQNTAYLHLRGRHYRIPPTCRQERDFCRRRLARRKRLRDDISAQRPEIGDHHAREMAAKAPFVLAGLNIRVSEDWVVETVDIELAAHHAVLETSLLLSWEREFLGRDGAPESDYSPQIMRQRPR